MARFYFDDSKHPRYGFSLGVFVLSDDDPTNSVHDAIAAVGLVPKVDEYKSSAIKKDSPELKELRLLLLNIIFESCRLGVLIVNNDLELGREALHLLSKMAQHPDVLGQDHSVYLDQGLFKSAKHGQTAADNLNLKRHFTFHFEQNSVAVAGIQLADLAAHHCSTILAEALGYVTKKVPAGESSGYDPEMNMEIGFELWADSRYRFLFSPLDLPRDWDGNQDDLVADMKKYALHVAPSVDDNLRKVALHTFGSTYLGCIH
ncbi:MAG: hypothetical protein AB7F76_14490 [Parvibaculaceae bacterium]